MEKMRRKDKLSWGAVVGHLKNLESEPSYYGKPLKERLAGLWSYRTVKLRIIYEVQEAKKIVFVVTIGPRRNVYEKL